MKGSAFRFKSVVSNNHVIIYVKQRIVFQFYLLASCNMFFTFPRLNVIAVS